MAVVPAKSSRQLVSTEVGSSSQRAYRPSMKSMFEPERNVSVGFGMGGWAGGVLTSNRRGGGTLSPRGPLRNQGRGGVGR